MRHFSPLTGEWTVVTHEYDASTGLRTGLVYSTGAPVDYTYDGFARLESITHTDSGGLEFLKYEYERDKSGIITRKTQTRDDGETEAVAVWAYEHDNQRRMTKATLTEGANTTVIDYVYGTNGAPATEMSQKTVDDGTPTTTDYTVNAAGQLVAEGERTYEYDPWGQLLTVKDNGTTRQEMTWAADGTMTAATLYTAGGSFIKTVTFAYDEHGMRVGRGELGSGGEPTGESTRWLRNWRNFTVHSDELVELGADGEPVGDVAYGDGSRGSRLLAATHGGATPATASVHVDHMGSPGALTAADGAYLPNTDINYAPFGIATPESAAIDRHYTGQPWDADLGLQYHRYRWLNTTNARWTSPDPIFDFPNDFGSDYAYAGYSPAMMEDVSGLFSLGEVNVAAAIQGVLTQIVVPELIGYLIRTAFVASGVDPMRMIAPIFVKISDAFGMREYANSAFTSLRNGLNVYTDMGALIGGIKNLVFFLTIAMVALEGALLAFSALQLFLNRNVSHAMEFANQLVSFIHSILASSNAIELEVNPVMNLGVLLSQYLRSPRPRNAPRPEIHHFFPESRAGSDSGERKLIRMVFDSWAQIVGEDFREWPMNKRRSWQWGSHSVSTYRLMRRAGSRYIDLYRGSRSTGNRSTDYRKALRATIRCIAWLVDKNPWLLDSAYRGGVKFTCPGWSRSMRHEFDG